MILTKWRCLRFRSRYKNQVPSHLLRDSFLSAALSASPWLTLTSFFDREYFTFTAPHLGKVHPEDKMSNEELHKKMYNFLNWKVEIVEFVLWRFHSSYFLKPSLCVPLWIFLISLLKGGRHSRKAIYSAETLIAIYLLIPSSDILHQVTETWNGYYQSWDRRCVMTIFFIKSFW